jgi:pyruvate dehydrogenase E1 component beta subunit
MPIITNREALNAALDEEMTRDETVFLMGEEVGEYNGAYKVSKGLLDKFGPKRVIDTPITELGFTGLGVGAAMAGLRPVVEWMTHNFALLALDQVVNNAAKMRYMSGGQFRMPIVFRGPNGPAEYLASQHSQALQSYYAHVPGLKVVAPATPYDAKGLLKSAIRDDNPVVVLEGELMYSWKGEVPEEEYLVPIGKADVKRQGRDLTIVTYSKPLKVVQEAAEILAGMGIDAEVVDLRSLRPLDEETVYASVRKTNRVVVVDESWPVASVGSHVAWLISRNCFDMLDAPVEFVSSEDVPLPYNHRLELAAQPSADKVVEAAKKVLYREV